MKMLKNNLLPDKHQRTQRNYSGDELEGTLIKDVIKKKFAQIKKLTKRIFNETDSQKVIK